MSQGHASEKAGALMAIRGGACSARGFPARPALPPLWGFLKFQKGRTVFNQRAGVHHDIDNPS